MVTTTTYISPLSCSISRGRIGLVKHTTPENHRRYCSQHIWLFHGYWLSSALYDYSKAEKHIHLVPVIKSARTSKELRIGLEYYKKVLNYSRVYFTAVFCIILATRLLVTLSDLFVLTIQKMLPSFLDFPEIPI